MIEPWQHPPSGAVPVDLEQLTPVLRALLTEDGTVTVLLWALMGETITAIPLAAARPSDSDGVLESGMLSIVRPRQVVLRGTVSGRCYCCARSLVFAERLPATFPEALQNSSSGLGGALNRLAVETRREILWTGREVVPDVPVDVRSAFPGAALVRCYRIIHGGRTAILIQERFPAELEIGIGTR